MTARPSTVELEHAITAQAKQAARHPRWWEHYEWTHQEINRLLDEWERSKSDDQGRIRRRVQELFGPRP
jgi:hypothetical protein